MRAGVGALPRPVVELGPEVGLVRELAAGLEARLHLLLQSFDRPLGLSVARPAEDPTHPQLAAEAA